MPASISVRSDFQEVRRYLSSVQRRQLPFATSLALNRTAADVRKSLQQGLHRDLDRPTRFTTQGIQFFRATKRNLTAVVFIEAKRYEYLRLNIEGGTRRPKRRVILIGLGKRNRYGNIPGFRQLRSRLLARGDHFEATINGVAGIWRRYKRKPPKLVVAYVDEAEYRSRFRYYERAEKTANARFREQFLRALEQALRTA
jgi:hypothetical protein